MSKNNEHTIDVDIEDGPNKGTHPVRVYVQPAEPDVGIMQSYVDCWEILDLHESELTEDDLAVIEAEVDNWFESAGEEPDEP